MIRIWGGGGGGWGDPLERDVEAVAVTWRAGLGHVGRARDGLWRDHCARRVQAMRTPRVSQRARLSGARGALADFDYGAGRTAWEERFGVAAQRVAAWMPSLAPGLRRSAQAALYDFLQENGPGPYDAATTDQAVQAVTARLQKQMGGGG